MSTRNACNDRMDVQNGYIDVMRSSGWTISTWFNGLHPNSWRTLARGAAGDHQVIVENGSNRFGMYDGTQGGAFRYSGYNVDGSAGPAIDVREGRISSITALMGNRAIREGRGVTWEDMVNY